jgi:SPX domain protein involved in polyphosphate accumulation
VSGFTARYERLELKFLVDETSADRVRRQIEPYCVPDEHSREAAHGRSGLSGYVIDSLYLDSPALAFHEAKERGDPDRVKLRVRTYSESSPGTLEVKRRRANIIAKTRAVVPRELVEEAACGRVDLPAGASGLPFLDDFRCVLATAGAEPKLTIRYEREAYESVVDSYARVTFDRKIKARRADGWTLNPDAHDWCEFDNHWGPAHRFPPVVLEIKCESQIPAWVVDIVRSNELLQTGFSKYSIGIELTNREMGRFTRSRSCEALQ